MDFHQLNIFIEVARQKNFTRAAENLFLSQPTVSTHIKKLEDEVGTALLMRKEKGLELTEAGETLFQYAQKLLGTRDEALLEIQNRKPVTTGHLDIAASSVPGAYFLPDLLHAFRQEYPGVTFTLQLGDTEQVLHSIRDYTFDLGFTGEFRPNKDLECIQIAEDELILISAPQIAVGGASVIGSECHTAAETSSKDHSQRHLGGGTASTEDSELPEISLRDCVKQPFLMREFGSATRMVFEEALKTSYGSKDSLHIIGSLGSQEAIKQAVKSGLGISVITRKAVEDELKAGLLSGYRLKDLPLQRNFYVVFRRRSVLSHLCERFFEFTCDYFSVRYGE